MRWHPDMLIGWRGLAFLAGFAGASGVAMAAIGSHAEGLLNGPVDTRAWHSAVLMHLVHAAALAALAALVSRAGGRLVGLSGLLMFIGVLLFSGTIYVGALAGTDHLAPLAPAGGIALILAWLLLIVVAVREGQ